MKKIVCLLISIAIILTLCSCGNWNLIGEYNYTHVYVETYKTEGRCYSIETWTDSESGIEVKTKSNGSMFLSEGTYILFSDADGCPYCD